MAVDGGWLFSFLEEVSANLERTVTAVAVGGTALTLLGVKESTVDIDFTAPRDDLRALRAALKATPHGVKVDTWPDGQVFSQFLPPDYLARSKAVRVVGKVRLRALHPVDIVVTKAGRLDARDWDDIEACVRRFRLTRTAIERRARQVEYVGREETYRENVKAVVDGLFPRSARRRKP